MFAKLKQKIQDEGADFTKGFTSSSTGSAGVSSDVSGKNDSQPAANNSQTVNERKPLRSNESSIDLLHEVENGPMLVASSQSVMPAFSILDSPTSPIKRIDSNTSELEQKIKELTKSLKEEIRQKEKLQVMLEKLQDHQCKRNEEREKDVKRLAYMDTYCSELAAKLEEANSWKEKYIREHENIEELEGFQTQELAKVKHLLLICEQDLQIKKDELVKQDADLELCKNKCQSLEEQLSFSKNSNVSLEEESINMKKQTKELTDKIAELMGHKESLEQRMENLTKQGQEGENQMSHMQRLLSDLHDEHDSMKYSHEAQVKKYCSELEEKNSTVAHLEEKVAALLQRLANTDLGSDDKLQVLSAERDTLEAKLEECRQHLNEVKTNWCTKIEAHETQIAHLNQKIAEDQEESSRVETMKQELENQVNIINQQVKNLEHRNLQLMDNLKLCEENFKRQVAELETKLQVAYQEKDEATGIFKQKRQELDAKIICMQAEFDNQKKKLVDLELINAGHLNKIEQIERAKFNLLQEKENLERRCETQQNEISTVSLSLENSQQELQRLTTKIVDLEETIMLKCEAEKLLEEKYIYLESSIKSVTEERDFSQAQNTKLLQEADDMKSEMEVERSERKRETESMQAKLEEFQIALSSAEEKGQALRKTVLDLEKTLDTNCNDGTEQIKELKETVASLETEVLDKNKTIKLQQQRIGDMKKALQRELKVQSDSTESNNSDLQSKDAMQNLQFHNVSVDSLTQGRPCSLADKLDDINFRYIKHVILKFITSTEYEAQQLIKAVGVVLDLSKEEEQLIRETLYWKTSWFGSKPQPMRPHVGNRTVMS